MTFWATARALRLVALACLASLLALTLPAAALTATPSPGGATIAVAAILALTLPVLAGWSVDRGDPDLERRSLRPIASLDLALVLVPMALLILSEVTLATVGLAPAGAIAATATATYVGMLLAAVPFLGWRNASVVPVTYLIAVIIAGRGADADHPAAWAWIAMPDGSLTWVAPAIVLWVGIATYWLTRVGR